MKQKIQALYEKYGIKAIILLGTWWIIKWSALIFFGDKIIEWINSGSV
ncbi:MAG: hypothetical protein ACFHWX_11270 [Bacteroidota bacterium]